MNLYREMITRFVDVLSRCFLFLRDERHVAYFRLVSRDTPTFYELMRFTWQNISVKVRVKGKKLVFLFLQHLPIAIGERLFILIMKVWYRKTV